MLPRVARGAGVRWRAWTRRQLVVAGTRPRTVMTTGSAPVGTSPVAISSSSAPSTNRDRMVPGSTRPVLRSQAASTCASTTTGRVRHGQPMVAGRGRTRRWTSGTCCQARPRPSLVTGDGRLVAILEHFSDDRPNRPSARRHGLWTSVGSDWSSYLPLRAPMSPPPEPAADGWSTFVSIEASADPNPVIWMTTSGTTGSTSPPMMPRRSRRCPRVDRSIDQRRRRVCGGTSRSVAGPC